MYHGFIAIFGCFGVALCLAGCGQKGDPVAASKMNGSGSPLVGRLVPPEEAKKEYVVQGDSLEKVKLETAVELGLEEDKPQLDLTGEPFSGQWNKHVYVRKGQKFLTYGDNSQSLILQIAASWDEFCQDQIAQPQVSDGHCCAAGTDESSHASGSGFSAVIFPDKRSFEKEGKAYRLRGQNKMRLASLKEGDFVVTDAEVVHLGAPAEDFFYLKAGVAGLFASPDMVEKFRVELSHFCSKDGPFESQNHNMIVVFYANAKEEVASWFSADADVDREEFQSKIGSYIAAVSLNIRYSEHDRKHHHRH
jgi:hypothetical protein